MKTRGRTGSDTDETGRRADTHERRMLFGHTPVTHTRISAPLADDRAPAAAAL
jgi:hypothetical protein